MLYKPFISACAIALTIAALLPYLRAVAQGRVLAHVFSWVIWGITTFSVFLAQLAEHGGIGAWPIGVSGSLTITVAVLAYRQRKALDIAPSDWCFFVTALSALPLWYWTDDAFTAVLILTAVDILGFAPSFRKAYRQPDSESPGFFALFLLRNILVILALEHYSWTTVLFPAAVAAACTAMIGLILRKRP
ncbi:hypothetical protein [Methylomonas sp. HYX-M1]|uniref:hypothetical protein n=1 Tax=Methylomonas sp. HYX-M1 TaxID=3139307 RepID=UPI00345BF63C